MLVATTGLFLGAYGYYRSQRPILEFEERRPGQSGPETRRGTSAEKLSNPAGSFLSFAGTPSDLPGLWPWFRGVERDNLVRSSQPLLESWGEDGPELLWSIDLGEGHGGPAVRSGCVYLLDYDEEAGGDSLRAFSLADGSEIWRRWYKLAIKRNHGISRSVPAVTEASVISIGPKGHVLCVARESGDFKWALDMGNVYNSEIPTWYAAQCPLVDGDTLVLAPAGDKLMVGLDAETGKLRWESPNPAGWKMSHSSVMPMTLHGRKVYVYAALGGMAGVGDDGKLLFATEEWRSSVVAPTPIQLPGDRIFATAGYGAGSALFQVHDEGETLRLELLERFDKKTFACEQQTPIYYRDHLFAVLPNDGGALKRQLVCLSLETGQAWASGSENRFGLGPFLLADDKLFVLRDDGLLTMVAADPAGYRQLAQAKVLDGHDAWGPMALVHDRLLLRDSKRMICLRVAAKETL
jgi:outer membrane protein assembly factor BamB